MYYLFSSKCNLPYTQIVNNKRMQVHCLRHVRSWHCNSRMSIFFNNTYIKWLARSYIPLFTLAGNISFNSNKCKCEAFTRAQNPVAGHVTIDRKELYANTVHLKPKILHLVAQSSYQINTESYINFQSAALKTGTTLIEQLVPFHFISLKNFICCHET